MCPEERPILGLSPEGRPHAEKSVVTRQEHSTGSGQRWPPQTRQLPCGRRPVRGGAGRSGHLLAPHALLPTAGGRRDRTGRARSSAKPQASHGAAFRAGVPAFSSRYGSCAFTKMALYGCGIHTEFSFSWIRFVNMVPAVGRQASGDRGHTAHQELSERPAAWLTWDASLPPAA